MNQSTSYRSVLSAALIAVASAFTLTGCETIGDLGTDIGDFAGSLFSADDKASFVSPMREEGDEMRSDVQSAYDELVAMADVPADEVNQQYARYTQAVTDLQKQSATFSAEIDEAQRKANAYVQKLVDQANAESSFAGSMAEKQVEQNQAQFDALFDQARAAYNKVLPLINEMNRKAAEVKSKLDAQLGTATAIPEDEFAGVKSKVDEVLGEIDKTADGVEAIGKDDAMDTASP